jgi:hypothetical protein
MIEHVSICLGAASKRSKAFWRAGSFMRLPFIKHKIRIYFISLASTLLLLDFGTSKCGAAAAPSDSASIVNPPVTASEALDADIAG